MIERVIVAFDGSDLSREAFAYAVMLAGAADLKILAVHVLEPPPPPMVLGDPAMVDPTPIIQQQERETEEQRQWARRELDDMAKVCDEQGIAFEDRIESGLLTDTLVDLACATDLIAVGRKGRFARAGIGSSTRSLVKHAPCSVMVVSGPMRPVNRVLTVYDGSSVSKRALAEGAAFAKRAGWPETVLASAGHGHTLDESLDRAAQLAPEAQVISFSDEEQDDEGRLIEHAATSDHYALLFMGAYPDAWIHRLLFGGTTEHVLRNVGAPVVLVH